MSDNEITNNKADDREFVYQKLYDFILSPEYIPCKSEDLIQILGLSDSPKNFEIALDNLIRAGIVVIGKRGKIISVDASNIIVGTFRALSSGNGFLIPDDKNPNKVKKQIFIPEDCSLGAVTGDRVWGVISKGACGKVDGMSACGKITRILERKKRIINGVVIYFTTENRKRKNATDVELCVKPYDKHFPFLIRLSYDSYALPNVGDLVSVHLLSDPKNGIAIGTITENFGSSETIVPVYNAILSENGIPTDEKSGFSDEQIAEAEKISLKSITQEDVNNRTDLRSEVIFTIDGEDAKDLDDAISVKKIEDEWILGVHIADVSNYVEASSTLDTEAFDRGMSVYFPDKVVPMLPPALSNGICSLNAGEDRLTLSIFITMDKNGNIVSSELCESIIRSKIRGVYGEINDYIEKGEDSSFFSKYDQIGETIKSVIELYRVLESKSIKRGSLELATSEAKIILDEDNNPISVQPLNRGIGEKIIEQFMLCANEAVASTLFWSELPCIYRIHEEPSPIKMRQFVAFAHNLELDTAHLRTQNIYSSSLGAILCQAEQKNVRSIVSNVLLRSLMKARYSSSPSNHFGLAIERYCHFTSPIRRYPDLAVHRIVKAMLHGKINDENCSVWEKSAKNIAEKSSENELRTSAAEMRIDDLFKAKYMSYHIGEVFDGIIGSVMSFGFFVELENTCEGLVHVSSLDGFYSYDEVNLILSCGKSVYRLGQSVKVKINSVDLLTGKAEFKVIG